MKRLGNILLLLIISINSFGTAQFGDILIWNNDTLTLFSNPLELHPKGSIRIKLRQLLEEQDRIVNPEKYESDEIEGLGSTACHRGYIAEWIIIDKGIYLNNIYACHDSKVKADLTLLFPNEIENGIIKADWINEELFVPIGECLEYVHFDYGSIYETEIILEFENGVLIENKTYNNYIAKKSKFSSDPNPNNYLEFVYTKINWDKLPDIKNKHIQVFVGIQPNKDGQIDSLLSNYTYMIDTSTLITDRNNAFIKEAIRIAELIPDWDVVYQRGLIVSRSFSIVFNENMKKKYAR